MANLITTNVGKTVTTFQFKEGVSEQQKQAAVKTHSAALNLFLEIGNGFEAFEAATSSIMKDQGCIKAKCEVPVPNGTVVAIMGADQKMAVFFKNSALGKTFNTTSLVDKVDNPIAAL